MIRTKYEKIKRYVQQLTSKKQRKYMYIIAFLGGLLLVFSSLLQNKSPEQNQEEMFIDVQKEELKEVSLLENVTEIELSYEKSLQTMLNNMQGISETEVMVNIDSTNVQVFEKDIISGIQSTDETDRNGGRRRVEDETKETKLVYIREGDQEKPVLVQTKKPAIRGVFIIAKGVENANLKQRVIESVSKVLDVPTYKISVMPK